MAFGHSVLKWFNLNPSHARILGGGRGGGGVGPEIQNYQIHSVKLGLVPLPRQANLSPGLSGKINS